MHGDERVIEFLNEQLTAELTAINQYFLHAKMQQNFGWVKLARHTRDESVDEMRHAETLADRILFLDALPNFQRLFPLRIGQTVTQMFESDMAVETEAVDRLRRGIEYMRSIGDVTSANIFEDILRDEEQHIDYLETQLGLVNQLGEQLYLAQLVEQPSDLVARHDNSTVGILSIMRHMRNYEGECAYVGLVVRWTRSVSVHGANPACPRAAGERSPLWRPWGS